MIKRLLFILILLVPLISAEDQVENYNDLTELTIYYSSEGTLELQGSSGFDSLTTNLYLFPRESQRQEVLSLTTNPDADETSEKIIYTWNEFQSELDYSLDSQIKTKNQIYPVEHSSFPIRDLDSYYEEYLEAGEIIDITPEIVNQAHEIIDGETDLYTAVHKIASWVNKEIEYDLNTLTAEAAQKSSWVLDTREGVCDEMTSLFISLLRSVGIPARFVSGVAYSNINYGFENHGWAEVYFPDQGWIPYDVTFTQFGWIDPGHLTLSRSLDAGQTTVKYSWRAQNTEITNSDFTNSVEILGTGDKIEPPFDMGITKLANNVGPGSYVPIKVTVENSYNKYLSDTVSMTKAPASVEDNQHPIVLKPSQEKSTFWIIQIPSNLSRGYVYTAEIEAKDSFGKRVGTQIEFAYEYEIMTLQEAQAIVKELEEKEDKSYSEEASFSCEPEKSYYYDIEEPKVICEVKNLGNTMLNNVEICVEKECQLKNLQVGVKEEVIFENIPKQTKLTATLKKDNIDLLSEINLLVLEEPDLIVTGFQAPEEIKYGTDFNISFVLTSEAIVENIKIKLSGLEPLTLEKDEKAKTVIISANSKNFLSDTIDMQITYEDENGRSFSIDKKTNMVVNEKPWHIKIVSFFKKLFS